MGKFTIGIKQRLVHSKLFFPVLAKKRIPDSTQERPSSSETPGRDRGGTSDWSLRPSTGAALVGERVNCQRARINCNMMLSWCRCFHDVARCHGAAVVVVQPLSWCSRCRGAAVVMVQPLSWCSRCNGVAVVMVPSVRERGLITGR